MDKKLLFEKLREQFCSIMEGELQLAKGARDIDELIVSIFGTAQCCILAFHQTKPYVEEPLVVRTLCEQLEKQRKEATI